MAEETQEAQQPAKGGGGIIKIALVVVMLLVAAGGGFATYTFVLAPKLSAAEDEQDEQDEQAEYMPVAPVNVDFEDNYVNVIMEEDNVPASTLMYAVTFECNNQMTADLVTAHMAKFTDMIAKLHDSRLRSELDDIKTVKESIQQELRQRANALLRKLQAEPNPEIMVTNVYHRTMIVDDKL